MVPWRHSSTGSQDTEFLWVRGAHPQLSAPMNPFQNIPQLNLTYPSDGGTVRHLHRQRNFSRLLGKYPQPASHCLSRCLVHLIHRNHKGVSSVKEGSIGMSGKIQLRLEIRCLSTGPRDLRNPGMSSQP